MNKLSSSVRHSAGRDEVSSAVVDALRMQIEDLEQEISEYEALYTLAVHTGLRQGELPGLK